jgi:hypothetical protein
MNFRNKLLLAGATMAVGSASFATSTQASIIDRPHFKVEPIIIVWAADDTTGTANMVTDFIVGSSSTDLIAADGRALYTGDLTPTEDALTSVAMGNDLSILLDSSADISIDTNDLPGSAFSAFDVSDNATLGGDFVRETSFFAATNTGFRINVTATETAATGDEFDLDNIGFELARTETGTVGSVSWGTSAQAPTSETFAGFSNLGELTSDIQVYQSTTRTAGSPGSIMEQSVRFDATYTMFGSAGYDLSKGDGSIQADVVYTFYAL